MAGDMTPHRPAPGHGLDAGGGGAYRTLVNRSYGARPTRRVSAPAGDPPPAGRHPAAAVPPHPRTADTTRQHPPLSAGVAAILRTMIHLARRRRSR